MNTIAFDTEICTYRNKLMQSALQFTHDHDDASDLVQDTLVKAIRYENSFGEGTNLQAWLYTIMKNTFINNYRSLGRRAGVFIKDVDPWLYPVNDATSKNEGECKMIGEDITKALDSIQPAYAIPFLRYFEGYKYHEIAEELDLPIGTVKTRIHLARKALKNRLKMYA
ncbi:RNA polymerase sigma-70 factor, ECF subfamily protein [Pedobacter sp. BAL39]|uniref:sigma-70 family RNA polymerase sigma factor n=1 Tax=Pedobacter sp. BAL39 TaxID=391596 RepID=UPI0001559D24|nr:sigma-70 family RNA polymerase sigma factor [Pedobacter sp. BAL39]EDM35935.1 RNA polymerase sigma-70 factor, ECF subfamily protein [Pedobacter sp. BAL39]